MYVPNNRALKYIGWKMIEPREEIHKFTIMAVDFNTPFFNNW